MLFVYLDKLGLFSHLYGLYLIVYPYVWIAGMVLQPLAKKWGVIALYLCQVSIVYTSFLGVNAL